MKKRLLITSIVMMLVVAVALSTATYAWFTSNTTVKADAVVLTASTMDGDAILITHNPNGTDASNTIVLTSRESERLYPATPLAATSLTTFTDDSIANIGANFKNLIMGETGYYTDPGISTPNVSYYKDTFYVFNKGFRDTKLNPTISIYFDDADNTSAMAAQSARIAIVERVATDEVALGTNVSFAADGYLLKGIWEFDTTAASTVDNYVKAPATYDEDITTYYTYANSTYTVFSGVEIDETNYDEYKANLYYIDGKKNTAVVGANGSSEAASGYGVVAAQSPANTYTRNNIVFTPDPDGFNGLGVATSGNHIANEYTIIVWLEGWDADCTNAITSGAFRVDVSFAAARV